MKWNSHGHRWLSSDRFPSNYALISLETWRLQDGFPLPLECCQAASLLETGVTLPFGSAGAQEPSEHLRGVSVGRRAMSLHQGQRWDSCCQFSLLMSSSVLHCLSKARVMFVVSSLVVQSTLPEDSSAVVTSPPSSSTSKWLRGRSQPK